VRRLPVLALCAAAAGCGDRLVYRPLSIDVQNLSATAQAVVLKVFEGEQVTCATINLANVQSFAASHESRWMRDSAGERQLEVPRIDADRAVVVVYTEDGNGAAIQIACSAIEYTEIETGLITLRLSATMAHIIAPWGTSSDRSSSIVSSVAAEWRRCSSPADSIAKSTHRWSSNAFVPTSRTTLSI
jgi:hypothetical protein